MISRTIRGSCEEEARIDFNEEQLTDSITVSEYSGTGRPNSNAGGLPEPGGSVAVACAFVPLLKLLR